MPRYGLNRRLLEQLPKSEQERLLPLLAGYEAHVKRNPLLNFQPHPKQHTFFTSREPLKAFLGGNRSGKTTAGIIDDLIQAVDRDAVPEHLRQYKKWDPPFFCRIVAPDFISTMEGVIFNKIREWVPKDQLQGGSWDKAYDKQRRLLWFENGSWFQFLTFEQDLDKHSGAALHRVHFDEEPPAQIRQENRMRLIDYGGDELFTMTPLFGMSWMYEDIYEPWMLGRLQDAIVVEVDMDDNPYLDEKTKHRALAGLTPEERTARKEGRFVHFGGMIYPEWRPGAHIIPRLQGIPDNWNVYVGIDPGQRHMAAVVYVGIDADANMVIFDEIALQGSIIADVCREIHLKNAYWDIVPRMYIIDPAAKNTSPQTGRSDHLEYADYGIVAAYGQNAVRPGIDQVKRRLRRTSALYDDPFTVQPSGTLHITANCGELCSEFKRYRWKSPGRLEGDPKEEPLKKDDHLLDALRYVCMSRPIRPAGDSPTTNMSLKERLVFDDLNRSGPRGSVSVSQGGPGRFT